jgi:cobalamin biosynthesis protein CobT
MPQYDYRWKEDSDKAVDWWFSLLHECFHNRHPEDFDLIREKKIHMDMQNPLPFCLNLVVDHNIEMIESPEYAGWKRKLEASCSNHYKRMKNTFGADEVNVTRNMFEALFAHDVYCRKNWMVSANGFDLASSLNDIGREFYDKLIDADLVDEYVTARDAEGNYQLTLKILAALGLDPEEEEEKAQQKPEKGEGEPGEDGEGEGQGNGEEGDEEKGKAAGGRVKYKDILPHSHEDGEASPYKTVIEYDEDDLIGGAYNPKQPKVKYSKDIAYDPDMSCTQHYNTNIKDTGSRLSEEIRQYLMVQSRAGIQAGLKKGRLQGSALWKHRAYRGTDAANRLFKDKNQKLTLDTAVQIVVDQSGSMFGAEYSHAVHAAMQLSDVLRNIRIPHEIVGFTTQWEDGDVTLNCVHKDFDESINAETLKTRMLAAGDKHMSGNADGESIQWAVERLRARKNPGKVMIVLSDGMPSCGSRDGNIAAFTKTVVEDIENSGDVDIFGLGIMSRSVEHFYKDYAVISSSADLETALLTVMKEKVIKNG